MMTVNQFPFGQKLQHLTQVDRRPKPVFVLGVYASAVHARWIGADGRDIVRALAVASEPYIFWRGENADSIVNQIQIPNMLGRLIPADSQFNGPSGVAIDEQYLKPLGFSRDDAWLCDMVPHSCVNNGQLAAINRAYLPQMNQYRLPLPTIPSEPEQWTDASRRQEILAELHESQAHTLILLGDQPIKWFLRYYDDRWQKLSNFSPYGQTHTITLAGRELKVLPLAHPRQVAQLGRSSSHWYERHQQWLKHLKDQL